MPGYDPWTAGFVSDRFTNWANAQPVNFKQLHLKVLTGYDAGSFVKLFIIQSFYIKYVYHTILITIQIEKVIQIIHSSNGNLIKAIDTLLHQYTTMSTLGV